MSPAPTDAVTTAVTDAATRLLAAAEQAEPCAPVRDLIGCDDVDAAYAVQTLLHQRALEQGRRVTGRKIGLTAPAVQAQLGVDQPDFGVLYADMDATTDREVDNSRLLQPRIEAEIAFILGRDLDATGPDGTIDDADVVAAVVAVVPALEIVDSRIAGWDISFGDTVADNASAGLYVLGEAHVRPGVLGADLDAALAEVTMTMTRRRSDGSSEQVSAGRGADCLGSPVRALAWLAATALRHGEPLRAGQVVLAGALGPMVPVEPGDEFTAQLGGIGAVATRFTSREENS